MVLPIGEYCSLSGSSPYVRCSISVDYSNDGTFDDAGGVAACCGQIQVGIFGFFVNLGDEVSVFNGDCDVHEVDRVTSIFDFPG